MAPVITLTEEALVARRDEILRELNLSSYEAFRELARERRLTDLGWALRDELDSIAYLMGEDDLTD
jgi:hypothetical protein